MTVKGPLSGYSGIRFILSSQQKNWEHTRPECTIKAGLEEIHRNAGARADRLLGQWCVGTQWHEGQAATRMKIIKIGA